MSHHRRIALLAGPQLALWTQPEIADELAARLATAPGLVRPGAARWDDARTPIHPLSMESAYADPQLLRDLGARGARFARELGVDVIVGAETAGVPLAASIALAAGLPFAFVRKPGYRGHELDEPPVRGADVAGRRVLFVDDAVSSGSSVERFTASLVGQGAEVDRRVRARRHARGRGVGEPAWPPRSRRSRSPPTWRSSTSPRRTASSTPTSTSSRVDALVNRWSDDDPRWELLPAQAA